MLKVFALLTTVALIGCENASMVVSGVATRAQTQAMAVVKNVQQVNDFNAEVWAATGCSAPFGELVRNGSGNPGYTAAVIDLCGIPSGLMRIPH